MEKLPEELLRILCQRLTLRDLYACCAVSRGWRDIFNKDGVWRPYSFPKLANYLETTDCVITPGFASPVVKGSNLSSLCEGRQNYMRELYLWKNWLTGKGQIQKIENQSFHLAHLTFYKNDYLVVSFPFSIALWDIREKAVVYVNDPCRLVTKNQYILPLVHLVYKDNLIVIQCLIVKVFNISLMSKEWSLEYSFLLNSDKMSSSITFEDYLPLVDMNFPYSQILAGDCLIGISPDNSMHIWNLKTLKKVNTEMFLPGGIVHLLHWDSTTNNLALSVSVVNETNVEVYCFKIYCLSDFSFKPLTVSFHKNPNAAMYYNTCVLLGPLIAIHFQNVIKVHNHMTGNLLYHLEGDISEEYGLSQCRDKIVLIQDSYIKQFNLLTETFETFVKIEECNISNFIPVFDDLTVCFTYEEDLFEYILFSKAKNNEIALCFTNELNFIDEFECVRWKRRNEGHQETRGHDGRLYKAMPISFEMPRSVKFALVNDVCTKLIVESCGDLFIVSFW